MVPTYLAIEYSIKIEVVDCIIYNLYISLVYFMEEVGFKNFKVA